MWLIGLLLGMLLGGTAGSTLGTFIGGILGLLGAVIYNEKSLHQHHLEKRIKLLEEQIKRLSTQAIPDTSEQPSAEQSSTIQTAIALTKTPAAPTQSTTPSVNEPIPLANKPAAPAPHRTVIGPMTDTPVANSSESSSWLSKLLTGNILAKIGVIILFFGIASALKLTIDKGFFPISVRLILSALAAISMSVFGYRRAQLPQHRMFGLAMQGGGLGVLYLLVYFMLARYQIIGEPLAFILFTILGIICIVLAARQDGRSLAILGISGAFLSPVLATSGDSDQITLFSYFFLLNIFIISVNWFKGWRELNITGFIFTLIIGMRWAFHRYTPDDFFVSETFLLLFFLLYSATPVLFNRLNAPGRLGWGDGMLLYGTPLAAFFLQNHLIQGPSLHLAYCAWAAAAYYLLLWWISQRPTKDNEWLEKSLLGIAIGFFTIAIPLAFDSQLTSAFLVLEGWGVLYLGIKQNRFLARLSGSLLQIFAGIYFYAHYTELQRSLPLFNDWFIGCLIIVIASFASALLLHTSHIASINTEINSTTKKSSSNFGVPFLYWSLLWWFGAFFNEIYYFASSNAVALELAICIASGVFLEWLGTRKKWPAMRQPTALLLLVILMSALSTYEKHHHVLSNMMALLIPLALFIHFCLLRFHDRDNISAANSLRHALGYWFLIILVGIELTWAATHIITAQNSNIDTALFKWLAWGMAGTLGILASLYGFSQEKWPFVSRPQLYLQTLQLPIVLILFIWLIYGNFHLSGGMSNLPYIPLINAFDLMQLLTLYTLWKWLRRTKSSLFPIFYGVSFLAISAETARITHHWIGVPFESDYLFASSILHAQLSILWTSMAMAIMIYASHNKARSLWFSGFSLLAIVGFKLILVDLSNKGTVAWTLSLLGIALLILAASYFSPTPPKK